MLKFVHYFLTATLLLTVAVRPSFAQQQKNQTQPLANGKSPFEGEWEWEKNDINTNFTLKISRDGNYLKGTYCCVMQKGAKIDCASRNQISFAVPIPRVTYFTAPFKSAYTAINGKVKLSFDGFNIKWELTERPKGLYFCPSEAVLTKVR